MMLLMSRIHSIAHLVVILEGVPHLLRHRVRVEVEARVVVVVVVGGATPIRTSYSGGKIATKTPERQYRLYKL